VKELTLFDSVLVSSLLQFTCAIIVICASVLTAAAAYTSASPPLVCWRWFNRRCGGKKFSYKSPNR
jgi:hypothetical protein